ncbi:MAG TPA: HD domain-containing protein [Candidatus Dependentiae bacterium]|nr:HD domain-containing protein [Candidatus Dependentiae bacterium]HRQ62610.1 HD domain-containing protein [Candidatus Dependentiae bacterium]
MKFTKIDVSKQSILTQILKKYPLVQDIVHALDAVGGKVVLVGGAVRDLLLGLPVKDLDIEVHNLLPEQVEDILCTFGPVSLIGKSFGVFRVHKLDVDWSLPRTDTHGRKPHVAIDPFMGFVQAFRRRDLTINAMGIDLITYELIDPFHGQQDLRNKILRETDAELFVQDPLRFYRVMQFISRFNMVPAESLNVICMHMDIKNISVERIEAEFNKLMLKSQRPSLGIRWIQAIGRLHTVLPELHALVGVEQGADWHPEGDVFEHTMQTLDASVATVYTNQFDTLVLRYAALCHDLGKATHTQKIDGKIWSHGHDKAGDALTRNMLKRITRNKELIDAVCKLVSHHMAPLQFVENGAKKSAYKRLANKLAPQVTMGMLADLALADRRGRNPDSQEPLVNPQPEVEEFRARAQQAHVLTQIEQPILQGADLLDSVQAGPRMGQLLREAYEIQLEEGIKDKDELKRRILSKK